MVNLTNIDDEPPRSEYLDQTEILSFDEEKRSIVELDFDDPDVPGSPFVRAEILNVDDYNLFELTDAGLLQTVALDGLDFETDKSLYKISIFVEDGADQNKTYNLQLLLDDVDENPPVFTSGANIASHLAIIPENQYFVYEVNATDLESENLVYGMTEGLDSEYFEFNANTRTLSFKTPPDYEALVTDLGVQPEYRVSLSVSDGTNSVSQTVTIQVTDDNDLPYLKINEYTLLEDALRFEATLDIEDQDGDLVSASLHSGPLHGSLQMDVLNLIYIPDPDFFGEDRVEVLLDDEKETTVVEFTLFVEPQNDRPVAVDDTIYFYQKNRKFNPYIGFNVLKNDHAGVDAKEEEVNYRVEPAQAKTVNGVTIITNDEMPGFFGFYPPAVLP